MLPLQHSLYWHGKIKSANRREVNFCAIVKSVWEKNFVIRLQLGSTTDLNEIAMTIICSTQLRTEYIPKLGDVIIVLHANLIVDERFRVVASLKFHSPEPKNLIIVGRTKEELHFDWKSENVSFISLIPRNKICNNLMKFVVTIDQIVHAEVWTFERKN